MFSLFRPSLCAPHNLIVLQRPLGCFYLSPAPPPSYIYSMERDMVSDVPSFCFRRTFPQFIPRACATMAWYHAHPPDPAVRNLGGSYAKLGIKMQVRLPLHLSAYKWRRSFRGHVQMLKRHKDEQCPKSTSTLSRIRSVRKDLINVSMITVETADSDDFDSTESIGTLAKFCFFSLPPRKELL